MTNALTVIAPEMKLPALVREALLDLIVAYPVPQAEDDQARRLRVFVRAIEGFEVGIAREALLKLQFNNPRNPFPPTPKDVNDLCRCIAEKHGCVPPDWWRGKEAYVRECSADGWKLIVQRYANGEWPIAYLGHPPGHPDCLFHPDVIKQLNLLERTRSDRNPAEHLEKTLN